MRIIILLLAMLLPGAVGADVFTPPPTDKSVEFLGLIFGPTLIRFGGVTNPALLHMFERFNTAIITLGTMIISYIAIISTINTAQEGHVMGRRWNSMWIPLRTALGMLLIVPAPQSGYSVMQNIVIWCIMQGIGAADSVWNGILNDLSNGLSATQGINRPAATDVDATRIYDALELIGADMADALLHSAVCMQTIHKMRGFNIPNQSHIKTYGGYVQDYETISNNNLSNTERAEYSGTYRIGVPGKPEFSEICGKYAITGIVKRDELENPDTVSVTMLEAKAKDIYQHKIWALQLILNNFYNLADYIVDELVQPRDQKNRLAGLNEDPIQPGGYRSAAINIYRDILKFQVKPRRIDSIKNIILAGKESGWLAAGSFYFALNQTHTINFFNDIMTPPTTQLIPRCDDPALCSNYVPDQFNLLSPPLRDFLEYGTEISFMGTRLWDAKIYMDHDSTMTTEVLNLNNNNNTQRPLNVLQNNMLNLLREMMHEQHHDPLIAQGRFGASIMLLSERAWLDTQNELHTVLNRAEQGYTQITTELLQRINNLSQRGALAMAIYSIVWIIGAVLAIYIPLIPYLIFTIGVVGWLLLVIEAVVAAPILAISFMLPTNDEMGKAIQGLLLLLNILLRPVLMLFGFILSTRVYQASVKLVNFGMLTNFDALNTGESLFAWVAILMLYATFIIVLSNKCFALIYALPDKILRWMGGVPEQSDPSHELETSKSALMKGADTINKVSIGIPERSFARLQARAKQLAPPDAVSL